MTTTRYFKVLDPEGRSCNGGDALWSLPDGGQPGEWMPPIKGPLVPCKKGYHLCREADLIHWLGPVIWEAETKGRVVERSDKVVARNVRLLRHCEHWNERTARLFACWCAEQVLHLFEAECPHDTRPRQCIKTARRVAVGDLPASALIRADGALAATGSAARSAAAQYAARAAARAAAEDAARAADAARSDARDAAGEAARATAGAAVWAAWAAAGAAADTARAARADAGTAAWDAESAVRAAAKAEQVRALMQMLETGELP